MLVATREPSSHSGTQPAQPTATGFSRFVSFVQIAGSLLAVPLGLASGYSIYHANFSTEARCQGLRANIVSMLDKSADASTLRMLVRRDVANFEQSCGSVDPDAVAAFKTLLSTKKVAATATHAGAVKLSVRQANAKPVTMKHAEARPAESKSVEVKTVEDKAAAHEMSDAKWLTSVREALVSHHAEPAKPVEPAAPAEAAHTLQPVTASVAPAMPAAVAPALPAPSAPPLQARTVPVPPAAVVPPAVPPMQTTAVPVQPAVAAVPRRERDHPVPPALIPEGAVPPVAETASNTRSGTLLSRVPLIGSMLGR